jgi:hypothetical protein
MRKTVSRLIVLGAAIALTLPVMAQHQENHPPNNNALVLLLQSKGILSSGDVAAINQASSPDEANARLAQLLME